MRTSQDARKGIRLTHQVMPHKVCPHSHATSNTLLSGLPSGLSSALLSCLCASAACGGQTTDQLGIDTNDASDINGTSDTSDTNDANDARDASDADASDPRGPTILSVGGQAVDEDGTLVVPIIVKSETPSRVWVEGLPPGAVFDESAATIVFTPDFTQGGGNWNVTVHALNKFGTAKTSFAILAIDTIHPPQPVVASTKSEPGYDKLMVLQTTDTYLDSPVYAGREFAARVYVP
ncbi:MAG: hypothetical protein FWD57_08915, partial [Polyangiaceae bacterium]|nr:hypothetical protein [Polyangiaceae bacterium]